MRGCVQAVAGGSSGSVHAGHSPLDDTAAGTTVLWGFYGLPGAGCQFFLVASRPAGYCSRDLQSPSAAPRSGAGVRKSARGWPRARRRRAPGSARARGESPWQRQPGSGGPAHASRVRSGERVSTQQMGAALHAGQTGPAGASAAGSSSRPPPAARSGPSELRLPQCAQPPSSPAIPSSARGRRARRPAVRAARGRLRAGARALRGRGRRRRRPLAPRSSRAGSAPCRPR